jgi:hypothetical protein
MCFTLKKKEMAVKPATKKGSPSKSTKVESPREVPKKKVEQKRKSRHQYDRITHQVFTPLFSGLEAHLTTKLVGTKVTSEDIHNAIVSYDAKAYFTQTFESKSRRSSRKTKQKGKRPLSTFMLFQEDMRSRVTTSLTTEYGRKPTQPEVVRKLALIWNDLKKNNKIDKYKKLYEENKRKAELANSGEDGLEDSD